MPITGVVVLTEKTKTDDVLADLKNMKNVTTYGIHKDNYIIAVFEGDTTKEIEIINDDIAKNVAGVLGVYPAYVNYEEDIEE